MKCRENMWHTGKMRIRKYYKYKKFFFEKKKIKNKPYEKEHKNISQPSCFKKRETCVEKFKRKKCRRTKNIQNIHKYPLSNLIN